MKSVRDRPALLQEKADAPSLTSELFFFSVVMTVNNSDPFLHKKKKQGHSSEIVVVA